MVCGYPSQGGKIKSERYKIEARRARDEKVEAEARYDNLTCACPPSRSYRSPSRGYPSQGSKAEAGQSYENEIQSKDAETPAITYVCASRLRPAWGSSTACILLKLARRLEAETSGRTEKREKEKETAEGEKGEEGES